MTFPSPGQLEYSRHAIPIVDRTDVRQILDAFTTLENLIVVNIVDPANSKCVFFTAENLQAVLADGGESLIVDALPASIHRRVMAAKIHAVMQSALSVRAMLRRHPVAERAGEMRDFVRQLGEIVLLLKSFALQNAGPRVATTVSLLEHLVGQIADSALEYRDNVRCMDDVQHEIIPGLKSALTLFE